MKRILVVGSQIATVQYVSRCCLELGADVLPYYGIPTAEEVTLFAPDLWVLCLPTPKDFGNQIQPYILWSERPIDLEQPVVFTRQELQARLQEIFQA